MQELLPDTLKKLWKQVEAGRLSPDDFQRRQESLLDDYRRIWADSLRLEGHVDLEESIVTEIGQYLGTTNLEEVRLQCSQALAKIRGEWRDKVESVDQASVVQFYDESRAMIFELMWWHTLIDDLSPLAYVLALKFAGLKGCANCLDFGSGVGSGAILFAKNGFRVTLADISSTALTFSKWRFEKRDLSADHIDLKTQTLPVDHFDFVTAMDVFEHLVDPTQAVRDLHAVLKKGGYLFGRFHAESDEDRPHHIVLDFEPTLKALKAAGFVKVWRDEWLWGHDVFQKQ